MKDGIAEFDISETGTVAFNDLVTRSQPHFSGESSRLCRLDEDARLLDRTLEVGNPYCVPFTNLVGTKDG